MNVMIGIDPHKASHTAVAIDGCEDEIATVKVRATVRQMDQLLTWAEPFEKRTWAIESVGGLGYLLAQQLVARGEEVLDVPATLASRIRVLATGRSNKNDANDAHSIAIAALRAPALRSVEPADHGEVLRLLAKRNSDLGSQRSRVVCRLHSLFAELAPGGIAKEMYVSDAEALLAKVRPDSGRTNALRPHPRTPRRRAPPRRPDQDLAPAHPPGREGFGDLAHRRLWGRPDSRRQVIGYSGDIRRFANRDAYASYNGTAPVEWSSGGRIVHRLSLRGNRKVNHALAHGRGHTDP